MKRTRVVDLLTESELQAIPAQQLTNPYSYTQRSYADLLAFCGLDPERAREYCLLVYDEDGELNFMQDLDTPYQNGTLGLALELPYSFEFRDDFDIEKVQELIYKVNKPSREATVSAFKQLTAVSN